MSDDPNCEGEKVGVTESWTTNGTLRTGSSSEAVPPPGTVTARRVQRGFPGGPIVARTLRKIENQWVDAGFPTGGQLENIIDEALNSVR